MKIKPIEFYMYIVKAFLISFMFIIAFNVGAFYGEFKGGQVGVIEFFKTDDVVKLDGLGSSMPASIQYKIDSYNAIISKVWLAILFIMLYAIGDIIRKGQHIKILNAFKGIGGG